MKRSVFTIGYEGADLDTFLATLGLAGVEHLIDVRDVPISRKRGFSKAKLADALAIAGIHYTHLKALGDPKAGRDAMKRGDYSAFLTIYNQHLETDDAQQSLDVAAGIARNAVTVLLCYERNPKQCHRTIVAEQLQSRGDLDIRHLGVSEKRKINLKAAHPGETASLAYLQT